MKYKKYDTNKIKTKLAEHNIDWDKTKKSMEVVGSIYLDNWYICGAYHLGIFKKFFQMVTGYRFEDIFEDAELYVDENTEFMVKYYDKYIVVIELINSWSESKKEAGLYVERFLEIINEIHDNPEARKAIELLDK